MNPEPLLDVVICTYNNAPLLRRTLESLANQRVGGDSAWGCLVVQNNCTDATAAVVREYMDAERIPRLATIDEPVQGLTPARAAGVRHTRAPWVAFVDDDCALSPMWVGEALALTRRYPDAGAIGGQVTLEWELDPSDWLLQYGYCYAEQELGDEERSVPFLVGAGLVAARDALQRCGWTSTQLVEDRVGRRLVSGGDVELVLRVASTGRALIYSPRLNLLHWVPSARTRSAYLLRMHLGLGGSAAYADAITAPSARAWRRTAAAAASRGAWDALRTGAYAMRRWARPVDTLMKTAFLVGYTRTAARLGMPGSARLRTLLGSAAMPA